MSERNTSHLVQRHAGQAGGHATALLLWIGHRVAVQSQQLLQRKLTGLRAQSSRGRQRTAGVITRSGLFWTISRVGFSEVWIQYTWKEDYQFQLQGTLYFVINLWLFSRLILWFSQKSKWMSFFYFYT